MFLRIYFSLATIFVLMYELSTTDFPELIQVLIGTIVCALLIMFIAFIDFKFFKEEAE